MSDTTLLQNTWILPFDSEQALLPLVGGKGANLARLTRAGLPVPGGFLITTQAYRTFVEGNGLAEKIAAASAASRVDDPGSLDKASEHIRALFAAGSMPAGLAEEILAAYGRLSGQVGVDLAECVNRLRHI